MRDAAEDILGDILGAEIYNAMGAVVRDVIRDMARSGHAREMRTGRGDGLVMDGVAATGGGTGHAGDGEEGTGTGWKHGGGRPGERGRGTGGWEEGAGGGQCGTVPGGRWSSTPP